MPQSWCEQPGCWLLFWHMNHNHNRYVMSKSTTNSCWDDQGPEDPSCCVLTQSSPDLSCHSKRPDALHPTCGTRSPGGHKRSGMIWSLEPGMQQFGHLSVEKRSYHGLLAPVHLNFKERFHKAEPCWNHKARVRWGFINVCTYMAGWFTMMEHPKTKWIWFGEYIPSC